jgi:hypothetical protein
VDVTSAGDKYRPDDRSDQPYPAPGRPGPPAPQGPYGPTPYDDPGALPHVYNPYGNVAYPASYPVPPAGSGFDPPALPARRPGSVHLALVLLLVSALPYLVIGLLAFADAGDIAAAVPPGALPELPPGVEVAQLVRTTGAVLLGVALVFLLLAVLAWSGRGWARALAAAMVGGFALMVLASAANAAATGPLVLLMLAFPVLLAAAGVALLFGSAARAWFSRPRR